MTCSDDDYAAKYATFMDAKAAQVKALKKARARLDNARKAYDAALADAPEVAAYQFARAELTACRRARAAAGLPLTDPTPTPED